MGRTAATRLGNPIPILADEAEIVEDNINKVPFQENVCAHEAHIHIFDLKPWFGKL